MLPWFEACTPEHIILPREVGTRFRGLLMGQGGAGKHPLPHTHPIRLGARPDEFTKTQGKARTRLQAESLAGGMALT